MDITEKVKGMAKYCDAEIISKAVGIPPDVIDGVLKGDIAEDVLRNYDPARPPEIKIVEKKKYIRSRSVGIVSTGGCGATTITAALGYQIASWAKTLAIDINEFSTMSVVMGIEKEDMLPSVVDWGRDCDLSDIYKQHPCQPNLFIIPGAKNTKDYINYLLGRTSALIEEGVQNYDIVLVDCPTSPIMWDEIFIVLDMIIIVLRDDEPSLINIVHNLSHYISTYKNKIFLVFNRIGIENNIPMPDIKYLARQLEVPIIAEIPESLAIRKASQSHFIKYPVKEIEKNISEEIRAISEILYPGRAKRKAGFLRKLFLKNS